jgi:glycosyltransferase involved in cell wall biosynthesis
MKMAKRKILFLYTELAEYTFSCLRRLYESGTEVHVVRYPVNKEAPFLFSAGGAVRFIERDSLDRKGLDALVRSINPHAIVASGWIDREYVRVCHAYSGKTRTVLALDNKWTGSLKQRLASVASRFTLAKYFHYAWVPGNAQAEYANHLGFAGDRIKKGFYSCDFPAFDKIYRERVAGAFPHRFIFAGRYYGFKGVKELWEAFIELKTEFPNDWELWCMGTGDIVPVQHPSIRHFGFVQPGQLKDHLREGGVFVMPSRFEPWGVVLHEFAAAGFPVICSDQVGAAEAFLQAGRNGYSFPAGSKNGLKEAMRKVMELPEGELAVMGRASNGLAGNITPSTWTDTLLQMLRN